MGMDVYGKAPTDDAGEYFRNNVWWWRPLWNYCEHVAPELCKEVDGHSNAGSGLDAEGAQKLAAILFAEIRSGRTKKYEEDYRAELAALPREVCSLCEGTGIRTDKVGQDMGMPTRELPPEVAILTGRTHGWCNGCDGVGTKEHWAAGYPFDVSNVDEFALFLESCGGFSIC
ncbi:MAG: hypothetical protein EBS91_00065 [Betaproteobacteria bacterium]|nr:hypothetical protein [Betaproteobacteria bacterium]NCA23030.1 hypothetical protein [Betaproteobacteria bacterium]